MRPIHDDLHEMPPGVEPVGDEAEPAPDAATTVRTPLEAPIAIVQERRRLKSMCMAFAPQVGVGDATQLTVGPVYDLFAGLGIARLPGLEQFGNLAWHDRQLR